MLTFDTLDMKGVAISGVVYVPIPAYKSVTDEHIGIKKDNEYDA